VESYLRYSFLGEVGWALGGGAGGGARWGWGVGGGGWGGLWLGGGVSDGWGLFLGLLGGVGGWGWGRGFCTRPAAGVFGDFLFVFRDGWLREGGAGADFARPGDVDRRICRTWIGNGFWAHRSGRGGGVGGFFFKGKLAGAVAPVFRR